VSVGTMVPAVIAYKSKNKAAAATSASVVLSGGKTTYAGTSTAQAEYNVSQLQQLAANGQTTLTPTQAQQLGLPANTPIQTAIAGQLGISTEDVLQQYGL